MSFGRNRLKDILIQRAFIGEKEACPDVINGVVCEWGRKAGVPTPFNDKIVEIIKEAEVGTLYCCLDNIKKFNSLIS